MIYLVTGADTINKGGELMLRSITERLADDNIVAARPGIGSFRARASMGLLQHVSNPGVPDRLADGVGRAVPRRARRTLRDRYGLVFGGDVDVVLDASGFAYSDSFALDRSTSAADRLERAAAAGRRIVLLPQAFGPFESQDHRDAFARILRVATLVYARDDLSAEYAAAVAGSAANIRRAPDFTCLLTTPPSRAVVRDGERLAFLVPSAKMLTHTSAAESSRYLSTMTEVGRAMLERGLSVRVLVHEVNDRQLAADVAVGLGQPDIVVSRDDAGELKSLIGQAHVVVGSRFHALVSALSQAVPGVAIGWSHKYRALFEDYGCEELVVEADTPRILEALDEALDGALQPELRRRAAHQRALAVAMWEEIERTIAVPA